MGFEIIDFGVYVYDVWDDYLDLVYFLVKVVVVGKVDCGIVVCGSGVGVVIVVNKIKGVCVVFIIEMYLV